MKAEQGKPDYRDVPKDAKACYICGKPIKEGVQYVVFKRGIAVWNWPWHVEGLGGRAGSPAFCAECDRAVREVIEEMRMV